MGGISLALLIDGENVAATQIDRIMEKARELGAPSARCVVGDFSANRLAEWVKVAPTFALDLVFQPSCGKGRNSADIALTIRAMDLLAMNVFRRFLLVSSDSDFAPLAQRLGRSGVAVFGMGKARQDSVWRAACTEFFEFDGSSAMKPATSAVAKPKEIKPAVASKPAAATPVEIKPAAAKPNPQPLAVRPEPSEQDCEAVRDILRKATEAKAVWLPLPEIGKIIRGNSAELSSRVCGKGKLLRHLEYNRFFDVRKQGKTLEARLLEPSSPIQSPPTLTIVASGGSLQG